MSNVGPQFACSREGGLDRRQLIRGSLGLAGVVPLCCGTPEVPPESVSLDGDTLLLYLEKAAVLRAVGSAGAVVDAGRKLNFIVARTGKDSFVALDRTCTHGGAMLTYNHRRRTLQCTSLNHAEFDLNGTLLHGRTHGNLRAYEVRRIGKRLAIRLARA